MKHPFIQCLAIYLLVVNPILAQEIKFGKVSKEELTQESYPLDPSASAAVLYRMHSISFEYIQSLGFRMITKVHERVKIYRQDGFKYATVSESLYKDGSDRETVNGLKAYTYNLENGAIKDFKLEKSGEFKTELNKYYDEEKFTMPNIKEGSVIEYQYQINSPFYWSMDQIVLQYDIPIKYEEVSLAVPEYFIFKPTSKGYLPLHPKYSASSGSINLVNKQQSREGINRTSIRTSNINYIINTTVFEMTGVPALQEEPYVNAMSNYRSALNYELQSVKFPNAVRKSFTTTWEKVVENIYRSDGFGDQLDNAKYFKDDLALIIEGKTGEAERMKAIFDHVQQQMSWNGLLGFTTDKGVKTAYKEKSGNTADINLMLIAMLREAGLDANPVLISTRDHGVPMFPTTKGFNYVVGAVNMEGETVFLDASNKFTKPNLLPTRALNWYGKLIKEDGTFSTVSVMPEKSSKKDIVCTVNIDDSGAVNGKLRTGYTDYNAYLFRNNYIDVTEESYLEKLESRHNGMEISTYNLKNIEEVGKPIIENYEFVVEDQVSVVGNKMYFSPLLHQTVTENPFKLEERSYPIDFSFPWEEKYMMSIMIPKGYRIESLPADVNLVLPNDGGNFLYKIVQQGNMLQLMVNLKMNQAIIPATDYQLIKELYKKVVEKETEKVVLTKSTSNGDQIGTTGGR
tara:strand:+ start:775 stop:2826 length:2052 start_codon:yes stop_codon:yes gene_type:complete